MTSKSKVAIAVAFLTVCGWASFPDPGWAASPEPFASVPALFRLTPQTPDYYWHLGEIFNSASNRYFFFYASYPSYTEPRSIIWCRQYSIHGSPLSGFQKVLELPKEGINEGAVAYNETDKCMFLVWSSDNYNIVEGVSLDNYGRCLTGGGATVILIKRAQRYNSALNLQVAWLRSVNRYAVAWTYADDVVPYNAMNGPYLTVLNNDFTFRVRPKNVHPMTMRIDLHELFMQPVGDRLLWTGREDGAGRAIKPLAFFTDFKGNIQKQYGTYGSIFPGGRVKGLGTVQAAYDPDDKVILLYWSVADALEEEDWKWAQLYYRLMGEDGVFLGPAEKMPRWAAYEPYASVCYNPGENRFFWVFQEYAIFYTSNPRRYLFKGKLWGHYMDKDGRLEAKGGAHVTAPIALTKTVSDPSLGSRMWGLVFNPYQNSYWTGYWTERVSGTPYDDFWGLIYK